MLTRTVRGAVIALISLLATFVAVQPAHAETRAFRDKGSHLTTVTVSHGPSNVIVRADVGPMRIGSYFTFWLDTVRSNAGPEYKMEIYPNSDGLAVLRVGNFRDQGKAVRCDGFRASADVFGPEIVTIKVPRSCIANPGSVRVSIRAYYDVKGPNFIDWGPGVKEFFGWVCR